MPLITRSCLKLLNNTCFNRFLLTKLNESASLMTMSQSQSHDSPPHQTRAHHQSTTVESQFKPSPSPNSCVNSNDPMPPQAKTLDSITVNSKKRHMATQPNKVQIQDEDGLNAISKSVAKAGVNVPMPFEDAFVSHNSFIQGVKDNNLVVCVEGNIGCGKTTLLNYFKGASGCEVLAEPVDKWRDVDGHNALEMMYQDPNRWSMALQTYIQLTMLQNHTKPVGDAVKLMERSIYSAKYCFTDNLFSSGKMPAVEHVILSKWFDWIIQTQDIRVDLFVYLRTDPKLLYSRIKKRCRHEEDGIPLEYLVSLHQLHEDWLIHKSIPCCAEVLVIDANSSMEEMQCSYEFHKSKILQQHRKAL